MNVSRRMPLEPSLGIQKYRPDIPGGLRELVIREPPAAFEDPDRVALLAEAERRDAASEAGADHQPVVVEAVVATHALTATGAQARHSTSAAAA